MQAETVRSKLTQVLEFIDQLRTHTIDLEKDCLKADSDNVSTQLLQTENNQIFALQDHLGRLCITLPVFGLNRAVFDINII